MKKRIIVLIFIIVLNSLYYLKIENKTHKVVETKTKSYQTQLEISKINLKQKLYQNSSLNNVNLNLQVLSESTFPGDNESHIYIAGHNGNSKISYFNNLDKLEINDMIKLYYQENIYYYELVKKEIHNKDGTLKLDKLNYDSLTLITCTKDSKKTQDIYIAKLVKIV